MTSEMITNIDRKSKVIKFQASKNYKSNAKSTMPYKEVIVLSPKYPELIFLVHENMIFERNTTTDSSYEVYSFDKNGEYLKKESVEELGREFFKTMKMVKKL